MPKENMISAQAYYEWIKGELAGRGDPLVAEGQMNYMRNQFAFYGVKSPEWMAFAKTAFEKHGIPGGEELKALVRLCYEDEHREMQYIATEMTERALKRQGEDFIEFIEELIITKSWWDTVDWIAKLAGAHFLRYPHLTRPVTEQWMQSGNIWLQRSALIFQLRYKTKTDAKLMFGYILRLAGSREFFIQKGAGWALREYSKTNPGAVREFVHDHALPPLTKREALKWLNRNAPG